MSIQTLFNLMIDSGFENAYSDEYLNYIESMLEHIRKTSVPTEIDPAHAQNYNGCLYIMLTHLGYPKHLHYLIMRLSGLRSESEFTPQLKVLTLPDEQVVNTINQLFNTQNKMV